MAADPLLETKLLLPRLRRHSVARPRLRLLLDQARDAPVTLVAAPAGFGKTTLLTAWLNEAEADGRSVAWVSLDERDRRPTSFFSYLLHALDRAVPGSAGSALSLLGSGQSSLDAVIARVVNEMSVAAGDVTLVLDDYHLADGPGVAEGMTFLVQHLPPQLHVVISTRADPALPLARLRARGDLVEVRAADLRFTRDEVATYLNDVSGLDLPATDIAALEARTEGWAAALQLAALSLQGRGDASRFVHRFAGDDRFVVDYLVDEVLDRQPDEVRRFLLDTSVLERLGAELCDAVTDSDGSRAMLDLVDRQNLFLVPLDDHRRWYRYHHLFADVLRAHLRQERPDDVAVLHRRASHWYADAGHTEEAARHALAADDVDGAADLLERALPDLSRDRREHVIRRWVAELPDEVLRQRPVLATGYVGALMASNDFDGVDRRLLELEATLTRPTDELVVADRDELARIPATIDLFRAGLLLVRGDLPGARTRAQQAIRTAPHGDHLTPASASAVAGLAAWAGGDIVGAHAGYAAAIDGLTRAGRIADVLGCSLARADMELALGRLGDAERTLASALDLAGRSHRGEGVMRGSADMLVALSRTAWHRNDLLAATDLLRRADELGEAAGLPQNPYRWRVALARLRAAERDWAAAQQLLEEAERVYVGDFSPPVHPIHATRARVHVAAGDLAAAAAWARTHGVRSDDELSYLREYEHVTLVRLLLARHRASGDLEPLTEARALLDRLVQAAGAGARNGTVIELEVLRALAHTAARDAEAAREALEHAVDLAEPDRWVRFLVDAAPELTEALRAVAERRPTSRVVQAALAAAALTSDAPAQEVEQRRPPYGVVPESETLLDPLSDRELDVLRLLASELDGPGIARHLVVSLNTVRTHTKHIYAKLGVNNRRSAISKAHRLGLLTTGRH